MSRDWERINSVCDTGPEAYEIVAQDGVVIHCVFGGRDTAVEWNRKWGVRTNTIRRAIVPLSDADGRAIAKEVMGYVPAFMAENYRERELAASRERERANEANARRYAFIRACRTDEWERLAHYMGVALDEQIDRAIAVSERSMDLINN